MNKTFNFYCDESCHLENDQMPFMLLAYTSCAYNQVKLHHAGIKAIKEKHGFKNEIKWSSVSKSKHLFYTDLIDYFFSNDLHFRALVVNKDRINNPQYSQSFDDFYYKMYFQLISQKINFENTYNIYLDIKDTQSAIKVRKLKEYINKFNIDNKPVRTLQNMRSEESLLLQLTDLLMGAIAYHLRGLNTVTAKNKIIEKIQQHTQLPLTKSTYKSYDKFNLFFIDLK